MSLGRTVSFLPARGSSCDIPIVRFSTEKLAGLYDGSGIDL
ncbi:hypothetical protein [Microcoleus sp. herbarium12]